ncbi:MAG: hypothetical protein AAFU71_01095 [Cyanobacteria bacterium J06632_22]
MESVVMEPVVHLSIPAMSDTVGFIAKVLLASALVSAALKYGGPLLQLPVSSGISLLLVLTPSVLMGLWLTWQAKT